MDLSRVVLTHHRLKALGQRTLPLAAQDAAQVTPTTEAGSGRVQEREKVLLAEIIEKASDLFQSELTDSDKLGFVNSLRGKILESEILHEQAMHNSKERFADSPNLAEELLNAIIDGLAAHDRMSRQALNSERPRTGP